MKNLFLFAFLISPIAQAGEEIIRPGVWTSEVQLSKNDGPPEDPFAKINNELLQMPPEIKKKVS
ncbi:MAG TPA: hypothetical protein VNJ08_07645 [Bacteriovoracaceae bacterium]|nr:hypothetical protein [Bacteriovoracaceae bacterium]